MIYPGIRVPPKPKIAWDIGGIMALDISSRIRLSDGYDMPKPALHSLDVMQALTRRLGPNQQAILSRIGPGDDAPMRQRANVDFINCWRYPEAMGITDQNLIQIFIGEREDKGRIYAPRLGLNVMIEDRVECVASMPEHVQLIIMNPKSDLSFFADQLRGRNWCVATDFRHIGRLLGLSESEIHIPFLP